MTLSTLPRWGAGRDGGANERREGATKGIAPGGIDPVMVSQIRSRA
jgi:hypothetical protein